MNTIDECEEFMLKHGENIVDLLGAEVDRIENELKVSLLSPPFLTSFSDLSTLTLLAQASASETR